MRLPEEEEAEERDERGGRVLSVCAVVLVLVALWAGRQRNGRQQWLSAIISAFPDSGLLLCSSLLRRCYRSTQLAAATSQLWSLFLSLSLLCLQVLDYAGLDRPAVSLIK